MKNENGQRRSRQKRCQATNNNTMKRIRNIQDVGALLFQNRRDPKDIFQVVGCTDQIVIGVASFRAKLLSQFAQIVEATEHRAEFIFIQTTDQIVNNLLTASTAF